MTPPTDGYWFPAKRYGWGWGAPRAWQGWAVLLAYVAVVAGAVLLRPAVAVPVVAAATGLLLWVCLKRGEPTRWRWGGD